VSKHSQIAHTSYRQRLKTRVPLAILSAVALVWLIFIVEGNYIQLSLVSSFEQHMRVLAPYMSDQRYKLFLSEWSRMTDETDYVKIYSELNAIAAENKIVLPENKIYSWSAI
jgi:hypothetical protein